MLTKTTSINQSFSTLNIKPTKVRRRNGEEVSFDSRRILKAIEKAFRADQVIRLGSPLDSRLLEIINHLVEQVIKRLENISLIDVEEIQDHVEQTLMQQGFYSVARKYIIYREEHARARSFKNKLEIQPTSQLPDTQLVNATVDFIDWEEVYRQVSLACEGLEHCSVEDILEDVARSIYPSMGEKEITTALIMTARSRIEFAPEYSRVAARLLLSSLYEEVFGVRLLTSTEAGLFHKQYFSSAIKDGVAAGRLSAEFLSFDLEHLSNALHVERDELFQYLGLQTLSDRYLLHLNRHHFETPQFFWMRVAMGLCLRESVKEEKAIEFYEILSSFRFISSTPTLFNSGTLHPQLSSCFLTTVADDLGAIFKGIGDNARLSKWAGGLGNDWTSVRSLGSYIQGTNGESQGVIPFLKVANDTAVAVNQGGKRQGAVCAYLETWHLDIEEFLELRKNSGDDRRRTHDMNTANWIPDLFMKRVRNSENWTLFSPNEVPELHDLYGQAFEEKYFEYEEKAKAGELKQFRQLPAQELWRKMLSMLFETGHPWITFKDPSNIRSPQDHVGVVHSSNLCTEILLNTSAEETAVCNLGSINLTAHLNSRGLDSRRLAQTVCTAVQMLDNVIDINFYPTLEAKNSNLRHRPIGLGIMGFQDCLYQLGISYSSEEAIEFADQSMEQIAYTAYSASAELAEKKGAYESFSGSKWARGLLPLDTLDLLEKERGEKLAVPRSSKLNWEILREKIAKNGMRNSNVLAIAPTATIANIIGVTSSIEPTYRNLYVKSNMSGDFVSINPYLVEELRRLNLWDELMVDDLKYFDGSVQNIDRIPLEIKKRYQTAFEIEPHWLIESAARRQKWIDMGQSLNLYVTSINGRVLSEMYFLAWEKGLKTTYYLRSQAATQIEKSTVDLNKRGLQPRWMKNSSASSEVNLEREAKDQPQQCLIEDPGCEVCQ